MAIKCSLANMAKVLLEDEDGQIKKTGKWPLVIDVSGQACTFLKYRNTNCLCALNPGDMQEEKLRMALLGSIRFGKPFVIDMMDNDMLATVSGIMDRINPKLMDWILSKEILKEEVYKTLIKESDGAEYDISRFTPDFIKNFNFILATKMAAPPQAWTEKFCLVAIG